MGAIVNNQNFERIAGHRRKTPDTLPGHFVGVPVKDDDQGFQLVTLIPRSLAGRGPREPSLKPARRQLDSWPQPFAASRRASQSWGRALWRRDESRFLAPEPTASFFSQTESAASRRPRP